MMAYHALCRQKGRAIALANDNLKETLELTQNLEKGVPKTPDYRMEERLIGSETLASNPT